MNEQVMVVVRCRAPGCTAELGKLLTEGPLTRQGVVVGVFVPSRALPASAEPAPDRFAVPADYAGKVGISVCPRHFRDGSTAGVVATGRELDNAELHKATQQAIASGDPQGSITVAHQLRSSLDCERLRSGVETFLRTGKPAQLAI